METNSFQKRGVIMENNIQDAIGWFDDLCSYLQLEGRNHWKTIKTALLANQKPKVQQQVCPECNAVDSKVMGFPWSMCIKCGYVYKSEIQNEFN